MWLWLITGLLVASIWTGGYLLGIRIALLITATLLVVATSVSVWGFRRWRAARRARALEDEILKQAQQQVQSARPERRAEILQLQAQVKEGIARLKSSKLGTGGGESALYTLPWYMLIGPPGAGKTTALRQSGLDFPLVDPATGGGLRGVGGTRNCDWWFSNEAILLDTAGRYATEQDDQEEWLAFLGMLRKFRPDRPLDGVIVTVSVAEVADASDEQLEALGVKLRARIDELMSRLDLVLPVYVLFSKADLISGFVEFWGDLRKSERAAIWGVTFPLATPPSADPRGPSHAFGPEFDRLVDVLHARSVKQVSTERDPAARARMVQFPLEFAGLKDNLSQLLDRAFQRNSFQDTPLLRGVYFASGTQEGLPLDRLLGDLSRSFGLAPPTPATVGPTTEARSYFVTNLFRHVIFADRNVAAWSPREQRRQSLTHAAVAAAAVLFTSVLLGPAGCSFAKNRSLIEDARRATREASATTAGATAAEHARRLDALLGPLQQLETWDREGAPWSMRAGMYMGDEVLGEMRPVYIRAMEGDLVRSAQRDLEPRLRSAEAIETGNTSYGRRYEELKTYLMLGDPEHLDVAWATPRLTRLWGRVLGASAAEEDRLRPHVAYYLDLLKRRIARPATLDGTTIASARSILLRVPQLEREYDALVRSVNDEIAPIRRESIFYGSVAPFVGSKRNVVIEGAYSRAGWGRVRPLLSAAQSRLEAERWVLGEGERTSREEVDRQIAKLRELYFERYKNAWRDFLMDLEVQKPSSPDKALEELQAFSEPEWPYLRLLRALDENTTLEASATDLGQTEPTLIEQGKNEIEKRLNGDKTPPKLPTPVRPMTPVEVAFKPLVRFAIAPPPAKEGDPPQPTELTQYQNILNKLIGALGDVQGGNKGPDPKMVGDEFQQGFRGTTSLLSNQNGFTRPLLQPLLINPVSLAWGSLLEAKAGFDSGLWETQVWKKWNTTLEARYPFAPVARDATLDDVTEFFRPQTGLLWAFYEQHLKESLPRRGLHFQPERRFGATVNYTPDFLKCLDRGYEITQALFPAKAEKPRVDFQINLHSVSENVAEVTFEVDGAARTYRNEPEQWLDVVWPAPDAKTHGGRLRIRGQNGLDEQIIRPGDFGLLRLLDAGRVAPSLTPGTPSEVPTLLATWAARAPGGGQVQMDLRPGRSDNPFTAKLFALYRCPRVISLGRR